MKDKIIILAIISFLLGCQMIKAGQIHAFELKVTNMTKGKIYPTVKSDKYSEDFGVVAIGGSATVGFSPFRLGEQVKILWEEGENHQLSQVNIDSSKIQKINNDVVSVHLIYHGDNKWVLKAFDKNDVEIGSVP